MDREERSGKSRAKGACVRFFSFAPFPVCFRADLDHLGLTPHFLADAGTSPPLSAEATEEKKGSGKQTENESRDGLNGELFLSLCSSPSSPLRFFLSQ